MVPKFWKSHRGEKLSTTYKTILGDTFGKVSRKSYGVESEATRIQAANPGVVEPLSVGLTLNIPVIQNNPQDRIASTVAAGENEVSLIIETEHFRFWDNLRITRSLDAMDTVEFSSPFEAEREDFRDKFKPLSYKDVNVLVGGVPLFTGTMVSVLPAVTPKSKTLNVGCYSLPGVLYDCTPSSESFPLEYNRQGLIEISETLCNPFGISVQFDSDQGAIFERVACKPSQKIMDFLTELAKQRGLLISATESGALRFYTPISEGVPVAVLKQGSSPLVSISPPVIDAQKYYSQITGIATKKTGSPGTKYTVTNARLQKFRPLTYTVQSTTKADVKRAVSAKMGRMFGNIIAYTANVVTWRDPAGNLWKPDTLIEVTAPDAMIYTSFVFLIKTVELFRASREETAQLTLVIPGAFNGVIPERFPWE